MKKTNFAKNQFKAAKKMRNYCKKHFPDWKDDEYNCGDLKFLWGLLSDQKAGSPPSFITLNKAVLYYSRTFKRYYLDINVTTPQDFKKSQQELEDIFSQFQEFIIKSGEPIYTYNFTEPLDFDLAGNTIGEVYSKLYVIVFGLKTLY